MKRVGSRSTPSKCLGSLVRPTFGFGSGVDRTCPDYRSSSFPCSGRDTNLGDGTSGTADTSLQEPEVRRLTRCGSLPDPVPSPESSQSRTGPLEPQLVRTHTGSRPIPRDIRTEIQGDPGLDTRGQWRVWSCRTPLTSSSSRTTSVVVLRTHRSPTTRYCCLSNTSTGCSDCPSTKGCCVWHWRFRSPSSPSRSSSSPTST